MGGRVGTRGRPEDTNGDEPRPANGPSPGLPTARKRRAPEDGVTLMDRQWEGRDPTGRAADEDRSRGLLANSFAPSHTPPPRRRVDKEADERHPTREEKREFTREDGGRREDRRRKDGKNFLSLSFLDFPVFFTVFLTLLRCGVNFELTSASAVREKNGDQCQQHEQAESPWTAGLRLLRRACGLETASGPEGKRESGMPHPRVGAPGTGGKDL